jgi:hypothetical protein
MQSLQKLLPYRWKIGGRPRPARPDPASIWIRMIALRYSRHTGLLRSIR